MTTMFRRFEIQSELSKSETALIYKALDKETNQIVALKTQNLAPLGESAEAFVEALIAEGNKAHELGHQNLVVLYGAGEIDGQFCAAMEYIQGNSVATMLARKEGFSIWDLLDITRQVCAGLEHAASKEVAHLSLEPAKIMVQWDGMVKILGYGISHMALIGAELGKGLGRLAPYCSPEQIRGEVVDLRSNLFSLGTILYEMVAGRKAFDAEDPAALLCQIENDMPPSPSSLNSKIQPAVSALIMKALTKDSAERYQNARELLDDLEQCKDNGKKNAAEPQKAAASPAIAVDPAVRTTAVKATAAAAGQGGSAGMATSASTPNTRVTAQPKSERVQNPGLSHDLKAAESRTPRVATDPMMSGAATSAPGTSARVRSAPVMSAPVKTDPMMSAAIKTDPMMSAPDNSSTGGKSFSDLAEMPPLKEIVYTSSTYETVEPSAATVQIYPKKEDKPRIQPREVAGKAIKEISTVPPRLILYSILGAVAIILVVAVAVFLHVRSEDDNSTATPRPIKAPASTPAAPVPPPQSVQVIETPNSTQATDEPQTQLAVRRAERRALRNNRRAAAPIITSGEALIDSNPQGALFQVDGRSDPSWITPFNLSDLGPGKHIISASKAGYSSDIRSLEVVAGSKSSILLHLSAISASVTITSTPPGASVTLDGRPTGHLTPAQFAVDKGSHTILLRMQGYLDETVTADVAPAQNFRFAPALRALGSTEDMRTVGKLNKLFGHAAENAAGMGAITIHTKPKGAQVIVNQRVLDKTSPVDIMLAPGNYVVDITMTGFKPIHKIVNLSKGDKTAIDETLERQ
jgi:eukaryotic-like serine/threonine-protein kinase